MTIIPLIRLLGTTIKVAGKEISIAGWIAGSGWLWLTGIFAAIGLLTLAIVGIVRSANKAERKLESLKEAATEAA
jgi:hypothetical protein